MARIFLKKISHFVLALLSSFKKKWDIFFNFVAFLQYLNFALILCQTLYCWAIFNCSASENHYWIPIFISRAAQKKLVVVEINSKKWLRKQNSCHDGGALPLDISCKSKKYFLDLQESTQINYYNARWNKLDIWHFWESNIKFVQFGSNFAIFTKIRNKQVAKII